MAFKLSNRSLGKLEGVSEDLVETVKKAIELTSVDFGVIYGVRSEAEQKNYLTLADLKQWLQNTLFKLTASLMLWT